jgi:branched-chain amino acid aminotransferase
MKALRFEGIPGVDSMVDATLDCVRANDLRDDMHLRYHAFPSEEEDGSVGPGTDLLIVAAPRPAKAIKPARCRIASWRLTSDDSLPARVKTVGYRMFGRVAAAEAKADGYDHILLLNDRGRLAESLLSNLFVVRHGVACTPAVTESILEGVTRATLLTILREDLSCLAQEREIDRSELIDCEEAFLCSTGLEIVPISSVDGMAFDGRVPGRLTTELTSQYYDVLRGKVAERRDWLTPVYN